MRIKRIFTVLRQKQKKLMVAPTDLALIFTSAISTENGGNLDHLMLWNEMALISRKILNVCYSVC